MVARTLVTSANETTWPKNKTQPILFLGEWCTLYDKKHIWKDLDYKVVPYHWHLKKKFTDDYFYISRIYEDALKEICFKLNNIHGVNYSLRYWRILVGPWLGYFLQMLFDRWFMLKIALEKYDVNEINIINRDPDSIVPSSMSHFNSIFMDDDWNEMIYGELVEIFFGDKIKINKISSQLQKKSNKIKHKPNLLRTFKSLIMSFLDSMNKVSAKNDKYFFISSYLPFFEELKIQFFFRQMPKRWRAFDFPKFFPTVDQLERKKLKLKNHIKDDFSKVASEMVFKHLPFVYLEGYRDLNNELTQFGWPNNPKLIFTSNAYQSCDYFKAWAAKKSERGSLLVLGQHGGMFGMTPFSFDEEHQIEISDYWISWGWSSNNKKVRPVGNLKQLNSKLSNDPKGDALLVTFVTPRYSYHMFSVIVPSQWPEYFNDQCRFISSLPQNLKNKMTVRLFKDDRNWGQESRWKDNFPNIKLDYGHQPMSSMLKKSRIFIGTYNSTTYLETLAWNFPTICFWNPKDWDLRDDVKEDFDHLKRVKILHDTPESAAKHLANIWDNIDEWWESSEVQDVKVFFCNKWSYSGDDSLDKLKVTLKELIV